MAKLQQYGVKYPLTVNNEDNYFMDINNSLTDKVKSLIMHVIFTPKGQKIRDPEFGTDLIKYIFEQNETDSWEMIKSSITEAVQRYVNGVTINNITILENDNDSQQTYVRIDYSVLNGLRTITDSIITKV